MCDGHEKLIVPGRDAPNARFGQLLDGKTVKKAFV